MEVYEMEEIFKKLIVEFWESEPVYIKRKIISDEFLISKQSFVILGPRRSGKSYYLYEIRDRLKELKGLKNDDFLYINFEDERLDEIKPTDLQLIIEAYQKLRPNKRPIIFFDEIHRAPKWYLFVRRLADEGYKVFITGSNSELLSPEIGTHLGARYIEIEMYPLSFRDFLRFKGIKIDNEIIYSKRIAKVKKFFDEFLNFGGFPEVAMVDSYESKIKLLRTYHKLIVYKDIVARWNVKNVKIVDLVIKKLREVIGNTVSRNKIYERIHNIIPVSPNTVYEIISHLNVVYYVLPINIYEKSFKKRERTEKFYFVDNGYIKLFEVKEDLGILLENLVFMEFLKKNKKVYYYRGKKECDIIVNNLPVQVCYELNDNNKDREIGGLLEAMRKLKTNKGYILTYNQENNITIKGKEIHIKPTWKFMLDL